MWGFRIRLPACIRSLYETRRLTREIDETIPGCPMSQPAAGGLDSITIAKSVGIVADALIWGTGGRCEGAQAIGVGAKVFLTRSIEGFAYRERRGGRRVGWRRLARWFRERIKVERASSSKTTIAPISYTPTSKRGERAGAGSSERGTCRGSLRQGCHPAYHRLQARRSTRRDAVSEDRPGARGAMNPDERKPIIDGQPASGD